MSRPLVATWWRSFLVQASWNYERMVGVGVAYTMEPLVRALPGGPQNERYPAALSRVAGFFNTHPYLSGMAAGALARAEYQGLAPAQVDRLRQALIGPLGAVGDQLIWAGWLPLSAAVGLVVSAVASPVAGVASLLVLYNVGHLGLRTWGLVAGWRRGAEVAGALASRMMQGALRVVPGLAVFGIGLALPLVAAWLLRAFGSTERQEAFGVALVALGLTRLVMPALSGVRLGLVLVIGALVAGSLWR